MSRTPTKARTRTSRTPTKARTRTSRTPRRTIPRTSPDTDEDDAEDEPDADEDEPDADEDKPAPVAPGDAGVFAAIERLLARDDIAEATREELEGYKDDLADGEFDEIGPRLPARARGPHQPAQLRALARLG